MPRPLPGALGTRLATVVVVLPLFLAALFYLPNRYWMVVLLALLAVAAGEWCDLTGLHGRWRGAFFAVVLLPCLALIASPPQTARAIALPLDGAALAFWLLLAAPWLAARRRVSGRWALAATGCIVLVPTWSALAQMQVRPLELLLLLGVIWISDSAAYFAGRAFGRHKLAPAISPGKTWEGVAGAAAAVALYFGLIWFIVPHADFALRGAAGFACALGMVALGIEGDLFESWLKRQAGRKDSGRLFPGHGGILDRIDSLTAAMPAASLAVLLLR